ncbi:hypothetical protein LTR60_003250 [Cryomyces antarcticus]|nr:hypothetical protein LTR60_003250 [Cryomyces antarcticus]
MFTLALVYNVIHSTALFYQVITLNVAVNSYSNALLTLLMSNQFVEIKGTVFKKFEKENLFQLTCADVVERFQLWLMLMIIALRNIVEVGGLSINLGGMAGLSSAASNLGDNITGLPLRTASIIPKSFTIFPKWTGQALGPFLLVLGSEMLVDWLKHAYITKFNNTKPAIYGRFLDILAKDYYSNAFADQNLTKRLGLPVLPLSCLFIRASVQTYHMFLATHMPLPVPSTATSLVVESASAVTSPATTAALAHIDQIFRRALGRSSFGAGGAPSGSFDWWSLDDIIAFATMLVFFLIAYLVLLALKLVLGMCLLSFARSRYKGMKEREKHVVDTNGKRLGGWGVVEVNEDKRRWIYLDDPDGARALREREEKNRERSRKCEITPPDMDHSRDPCPWVALSDFGGAFCMGAIGGAVWHGVKGFRNSPYGERRIGSITAIKARAPILGGNFGVWGGLFSTFDCAVKGIRKKEDPWNAIIAGFFTGGSLAVRGGAKAVRNGAIGCAILLAVIEGVGIGFQRMMAENTRLDVPPPPPPPEQARAALA